MKKKKVVFEGSVPLTTKNVLTFTLKLNIAITPYNTGKLSLQFQQQKLNE